MVVKNVVKRLAVGLFMNQRLASEQSDQSTIGNRKSEIGNVLAV